MRAPYARPVVTLLELLGQRWMLRIVWELRDGAVLTFRKLQERCDGVSPAVQNDRLAKLRRAGIVEHAAAEGYRLTAAGVRLARAMRQLDSWARIWLSSALHFHGDSGGAAHRTTAAGARRRRGRA